MMQRNDSGGDGTNKTVGLGVVGAAGVSFGLSLIMLSGCASGNGSKPTANAQIQEQYLHDLGDSNTLDAQTRLEVLAEREAIEPSEPARELANRLLGGQLQNLRAGSSAHGRAHRSVEQVFEDLYGDDKGLLILSDDEQSGVDDGSPLIPQLSKGYVRARAAMLDGEYAQAVAIYEQLAAAAPESTDVLVGLGDAYMKAGNRGQAAESYLRAVNLGDQTSRALVYAAMGSTSDPEQVIELAGRVWSDGRGSDEAARLISGIMLGQALIESGWYRAGAEVMSDAIAMLDGPAARDPRYRRELVQLYTKRGEQLATVGDAWLVLDQPDRAMGSYELARSILSSEPMELLQRRVAAYVLQGQSALGAMTLLDWIDAHPGDDSADLQDLVAMIGEHPLVGSLVVGSLSEYVSDQEVMVSQRRAVLGMLLGLAEHGNGDPVEIISSADPEVISAVACARMFKSVGTQESRIEAALGVIEHSPSVAPELVDALVRFDGRPVELLGMIKATAESSGPARLLSGLISLEIGRPGVLGETGDPVGASHTWAMTRAREAYMGGRYGEAEGYINRAFSSEAAMNAPERNMLVDTLMSMGRADDAVEAAHAWAQREPGHSGGWLLYGQQLIKASEPGMALEALSRAVDLDPYDETIYEQLITLRGSNGAMADIDELRTLTRSLGQRLPDSAMVGLIRAHELAGAAGGNGDEERDGQQAMALLSQGERILLETHDQHPWRQIGTDLLLSLWATQHTGGDAEAITRGLDWLDGQAAMMPGSVELAGARARLMVLGDDALGAERSLAEMYTRYPARSVGRLQEGLIRSDTSRQREADLLAVSRLEGLASPWDCLERLERAGSLGTIDQYDVDLLVPVDESWVYTTNDQLRIIRVLGALAQANPSASVNDRVLELIDRTRDHARRAGAVAGGAPVDAGLALNQIELLARAQSDRFDMDSYESLLRGAIGQAGEGGDGLVSIAVQSLMRGQSLSSAVELQARLVVDENGMLVDQRAIDLFGVLGQAGSVEDLINATDAIDRAGLLVEARDAVVGGMGTINELSRAPAEDLIGVRADLMYTAGVLASFYERDSEGRAIYRAILELDPDHAWANNDLGYKMVEDGDDLVEAERLLARAHQAEPNASSITDSLAWARYAIGAFDDELDAEGNLIRRGAKGLLVEALSSEDGQENATIFDHLGDTLWMLSEFDEAIDAWLDAEERVRARLTGLANEPNANQMIVDSMREELDSVRQKIADGESGRVPRVAPNTAGIAVPVGTDTMDDSVDPTK